MTEQQAQAHWAVYGDAHRPVPGPLYWDWRCLVCSGPVDDHPSHRERRAGLLARLLRHPCPVCERHRWYRDPYVRARPACPESWHRRALGRWAS